MSEGAVYQPSSSLPSSGKFRFSLHAMLVAVAAVSLGTFLAREFGGLIFDLYIRDLTTQEIQRKVGLTGWLALDGELRVRLTIATVAFASVFAWSLMPRFTSACISHRSSPIWLLTFTAWVMLAATTTLILPGRILDASNVQIGFEVTAYSVSALLAIVLFSVFARARRLSSWLTNRLFANALRQRFSCIKPLSQERSQFWVRICLLLIPVGMALICWWMTLPSRTWKTFIANVETRNFEAAESMLAEDQRIEIVYRDGRKRYSSHRLGSTPFWTISKADGSYEVAFNATSRTNRFNESDLTSRSIADMFMARNRAYQFKMPTINRTFGYLEVRGAKIHYIP